ncbi:PhoH family protein [Immundisolibacter sp.]|uniref:PhoH family protein n=1 Tax=Immundisolibacter sp. TaxID=1934948 RepID=UPI000EE85974|nr:phosphate starvation-inducible protein PhoH [Gammaproteobacteria bacterium]
MTAPAEASAQAAVTEVTLDPSDNARLARLCGPLDAHIGQVERHFGVLIRRHGHSFAISGDPEPVAGAGAALKTLYAETATGEELSAAKVHLLMRGSDADGEQPVVAVGRRLQVRARGRRQADYLRAIQTHDINFAIGPAGTGKTYLAVACAVQALLEEQVQRLVLVRPAVEAGEKLGFLPGDLAQKVDPYLRPIYDALYEMLSFEKVGKLIERQVIEIAPLAYMRGRTLNEAFIILDEAQNTTPEQMKMFLTRIGFGSTAVVTGDVTQIDLPPGKPSGLKHVLGVLKGVEGISFSQFTARDVVRHPLVERIVNAYERDADSSSHRS